MGLPQPGNYYSSRGGNNCMNACRQRRDGPIEELTLSIGRTTEYASSTTSVEQPAHLFTNLLLRPARSSSPSTEKLVATALNSGCLVPVAMLSLQQLQGRQE